MFESLVEKNVSCVSFSVSSLSSLVELHELMIKAGSQQDKKALFAYEFFVVRKIKEKILVTN